MGGPATDVEDESLQHLVQLGEGRPRGTEEVGGPFEEIGPRVLDSGVGGSADGVAADEEGPGQRREAVD